MPALRRILDSERLTALIARQPRLVRVIAAVVAVVAWIDLLARVVVPALSSMHFPTSSYWVAPRLVLEGRGHLLLDHAAFADAAAQLGAYRDLGFIPNAPMSVLPLLPLGLLPEGVAYQLWTMLSVICLIGAVAWLVRALRLPTVVGLLVIGGAALFHPLRSNLVVGQAYGFVLLAVVATAIATAARGSAVRVGLAQSAATILKVYYGLVLVLPELARRRWRPVCISVAVLAVAVLASAVLVGPDSWSVWLSSVLGWRSRPETTVSAFQTLHSLTGHLFRFDGVWNPAPVAHAPLMADLSWAVAAGVTVAITLFAITRAREPGPTRDEVAASMLPLASVVPLALVLSPIAEDHAYVIALFPLVVAGAALLGRANRAVGWWLVYAAALVLLAPPWPFNQTAVEGWWALLFYPRVYGALLLWGLLVALLWHARSDAISRAKHG